MKKILSCFMSKPVIVILLIGIGLTAFSLGDFIISFKSPVSFEDMLNGEKLESGDHVKGEILFSLGVFATEDTVTTQNGVSRTSKDTAKYFVIPGVGNDDEDICYGIKVNKNDISDVQKNSNQTEDFFEDLYYEGVYNSPTTTPMYEGRVTKMDSELAGYFKDYLLDSGYTESELKDMGDFLVIEPRAFTAIRVMTIIGFVLILVAVVLVVLRYKKLSKQEAAMGMYQSQYNGYQGTNGDVNMGGSFGGNGFYYGDNTPVDQNNNNTDNTNQNGF